MYIYEVILSEQLLLMLGSFYLIKITLLNISQAHQKIIDATEKKGYANHQCSSTFNFIMHSNLEMGNLYPHKLFCTI